MNVVHMSFRPRISSPGIHRVHVLQKVLAPHERDAIQGQPISSHHGDDPIGTRKNLHLPWVAAKILRKIDASMISPMRPIAVDEMMRLYRLDSNQGAVEQHTDEDFAGPGQSVARFSVLVFLNDSYEGGETVFNGRDLEASFDAGDALLFPHSVPHEGRPVTVGTKYVLKTDLFVEE